MFVRQLVIVMTQYALICLCFSLFIVKISCLHMFSFGQELLIDNKRRYREQLRWLKWGNFRFADFFIIWPKPLLPCGKCGWVCYRFYTLARNTRCLNAWNRIENVFWRRNCNTLIRTSSGKWFSNRKEKITKETKELQKARPKKCAKFTNPIGVIVYN